MKIAMLRKQIAFRLAVRRAAFTLVELAVVVLVLAFVALLAVPRLSGFLRDAKRTATEADMAAIRDALVGGAQGSAPSLVGDMEGIPGFSPAYLRVANLLAPTNWVGTADRWIDDDGRRLRSAGFANTKGAVNPDAVYADFAVFTNRDAVANRGWRGPYLAKYRPTENSVASRRGEYPRRDDRRRDGDRTFAERGFFRSSSPVSPYGVPGEAAAGDPWGNPYILQVPPAEAFEKPSETSEADRFRYARLVSAGPDGVLSTPCFDCHDAASRRDCRLAGRRRDGVAPRGDDLVLFLSRADAYAD